MTAKKGHALAKFPGAITGRVRPSPLTFGPVVTQ